MKHLLRRVAFLLLAATCWVGQAHGQQPEELKRGVQGEVAAEAKERIPVPQYALVILLTLVVLVIICKPSRKAYRF
jgi:hypothetical protein